MQIGFQLLEVYRLVAVIVEEFDKEQCSSWFLTRNVTIKLPLMFELSGTVNEITFGNAIFELERGVD